MAALFKNDGVLTRAWQAAKITTRGAYGELFPQYGELLRHRARLAGWRIDGPDDYCPRCGVTVPYESRTEKGCAFCIKHSVAWDRIMRLGGYVNPLDEWIRSMKFRKQWHWAQWFGPALGEMFGEVRDADKTAVCPVPMHWRRRFGRGYNQSQMVAAGLAKSAGVEMIDLLKRKKHSKPQWSVTMSQREVNVRGVFEMAGDIDLSGWRIILVDDVKTSGATLSQCARLLKKAGAKNITAAVIAVANAHRDSLEKAGVRA